MKSVIILFSLLNFGIENVCAKRAVVIGKVENTKVKEAKYSFNQSVINYKKHEGVALINSNGNFKLELEIEHLEEITLQIDQEYTTIYVQPGDSFFVKINYKNFDKSIQYSGANSEKNNFNKAFDFKFVFEHEQDVYKQMVYRKSKDFAYYRDSLLKVQILFLETNKEKLNDEFLRYFKNDLTYASALDKLHYPSLWAYFTHNKDSVPEMSFRYFDFIKQLPLSDDSLLASETSFDYVNAVLAHYKWYIEKTTKSKWKHKEKMLFAASLIDNKKILQTYEASQILIDIKYGVFAEAKKNYSEYLQTNKDSPYLNELKIIYDKTEAISEGHAAPPFSLLDENGKEHSLNDFKGKVVYVDFWASWCGPCIRELPFSKKIKTEFEGQEIIFLYISIDENLKSWKEAIKKHNIKGIHLSAPSFDHAVCSTYNIQGVPSYFLIGKDGEILDNNPPRPSASDELIKLLSSALK